MIHVRKLLAGVVGIAVLFGGRLTDAAPPEDPAKFNRAQLLERFGELRFAPQGGFILRVGQKLPPMEWDQPELVAQVVDNPVIPTRWFNERFEEVQTADRPGRYYAYGEAPAPTPPTVRRAMTCVCIPAEANVHEYAEKFAATDPSQKQTLLQSWRTTEEGAVQLAAWLREGDRAKSARRGQWMMENATEHVRLRRILMGLGDRPLVKIAPKKIAGPPAPALHAGSLEETDFSPEQVEKIESKLDEWYAESQTPFGLVIVQNGAIVLAKGYGEIDGKPVTIDTPLALDSAMKPLMGLQLATFVDHGHIQLDQPIGDFLPEFNSPRDRQLTFRAGHIHVSGIHFPWSLAFKKLFYFDTWQDSLIAHCKREWDPGAKHRYGVVGIILSVRSLELLRGRNYWDAMERDLFHPIGIHNVLPGGRGFSAESMARIGVLLDNRGKYGDLEVISEEAHAAIMPATIKHYFPNVDMEYGIGLKDASSHLGPGSYGHGGGGGTTLAINPKRHLVFAMVRNEQGKRFKAFRAEVTAMLRE